MATTDLHMQVLPETGEGPSSGKAGERGRQLAHGFAHTATLIREARAQSGNSLLLDNGDFLCGNGSEILLPFPLKHTHPMIQIMNHLGYDAAAPGNHDFDQGLEFLQTVTGQAGFPFVCANVFGETTGTRTGQKLFDEYVILERTMLDRNNRPQRLRIGIVGFLPPNSVAQVESNACHINTTDIIESARKTVARMKRQGADLIIALAHTGLGAIEHVPNMENAAIPLAAIDGIDVVISGHRHQVFPGPDWPKCQVMDPVKGSVHGKPVVSAGFWGSHLGLVDLDLVRSSKGWRIRAHTVTARPVSKPRKTGEDKAMVTADAQVSRIIRPMHRLIRARLTQPLGHCAHPLHTFFALAAPSRAVQLIQHAQLWHLRRTLSSTLPDIPLLSSACAFKTGGYGGPGNFTDTKAGALTLAAVSDLYPFPNRVVALPITGAFLLNWLERAASVFNRALPGMTVDLKAPEVPAYLYETVLGVDYTIDLSRPARFDFYGNHRGQNTGRIKSLRYKGKPVTDGDRFILVTNSYRVGGGGAYPIPGPVSPLALPPIYMQDVLIAYFRAHGSLRIPLENHWRFAPRPRATMRFRSAPKARAHLPRPGTGQIRLVGKDSHGYALFDLSL